MNKEVEEMLSDSPQPLPWTIAFIVFGVGAIALQSAILAVIWGILVGAYFGNYRGRSAVMRAWQRDLQITHEQGMAALEAEYRELIKVS